MAAAGDPDGARAVRRERTAIGCDFFRSLRLAGRAMAIVALEERDEAADVYEELREFEGQLAGAVTGAFTLPPVDLLLGDLAALLDRAQEAHAHHERAVVIARRCRSAPWIEAVERRKAGQVAGKR